MLPLAQCAQCDDEAVRVVKNLINNARACAAVVRNLVFTGDVKYLHSTNAIAGCR